MYGFHKSLKLHNIANNVSWAANQHKNDFWRSCDTEDGVMIIKSNDAENYTSITRINDILKYI